jgi:hypothetical protein
MPKILLFRINLTLDEDIEKRNSIYLHILSLIQLPFFREYLQIVCRRNLTLKF